MRTSRLATLGIWTTGGLRSCSGGLIQLVLGLAAAVSLVGCLGSPIGMTAQRGSTIMVPVHNENLGSNLGIPVGYGGTEVTDVQRGELQFYLDDPSNPLVTRASTAVAAAPASEYGRMISGRHPLQIVSIVDIPSTAPLGSHALLGRIMPPSGVPSGTIYVSSIEIIDSPVTFDDGGTPVTVVGKPSPFSSLGVAIGAADLQKAVPDPMMIIDLTEPDAGVVGVAAVEMQVTMGSPIPTILDVIQPAETAIENRALVWWTETVPGVIDIRAVSQTGTFDSLAIVFQPSGGVPFTSTNSGPPYFFDFPLPVIFAAFDEAGQPIPTIAGQPVSLSGISFR